MHSFIFISFLISNLIAQYEVQAVRYHDDGSISSNSGQQSVIGHLWPLRMRWKRDNSRLATEYGWRKSDIQMLVDEHNRLRRLVPATDMQMISWDETLASSAQAHANQCLFAHSTNRDHVGENIWASYISNYAGAVKMWFNELYDHSCGCTNYFKYCCGHYTQVAWASTSKLGCGYAKCNSILNAPRHRFILVCHYSPAGNVVYYSNGQMLGRPGFTYKRGNDTACSGCTSGYKCHDGLCTWS